MEEARIEGAPALKDLADQCAKLQVGDVLKVLLDNCTQGLFFGVAMFCRNSKMAAPLRSSCSYITIYITLCVQTIDSFIIIVC